MDNIKMNLSRKLTSKTTQITTNKAMRKLFFTVLATLNKVVLPRYSRRDLTRLGKLDKAIVAWRYWVTCNALG